MFQPPPYSPYASQGMAPGMTFGMMSAVGEMAYPAVPPVSEFHIPSKQAMPKFKHDLQNNLKNRVLSVIVLLSVILSVIVLLSVILSVIVLLSVILSVIVLLSVILSVIVLLSVILSVIVLLSVILSVIVLHLN